MLCGSVYLTGFSEKLSDEIPGFAQNARVGEDRWIRRIQILIVAIYECRSAFVQCDHLSNVRIHRVVICKFSFSIDLRVIWVDCQPWPRVSVVKPALGAWLHCIGVRELSRDVCRRFTMKSFSLIWPVSTFAL